MIRLTLIVKRKLVQEIEINYNKRKMSAEKERFAYEL